MERDRQRERERVTERDRQRQREREIEIETRWLTTLTFSSVYQSLKISIENIAYLWIFMCYSYLVTR